MPSDIKHVIDDLQKGVFPGSEIANLKMNNLDNSVYKVRVKNSNTGAAQANSYKLIYYTMKREKVVFLVTIYYKKDDGRIPEDKDIVNLISNYCK